MPYKDPAKDKAYHKAYDRARFEANPDRIREINRKAVRKYDMYRRPILRIQKRRDGKLAEIARLEALLKGVITNG